jgi:hypothetical protein
MTTKKLVCILAVMYICGLPISAINGPLPVDHTTCSSVGILGDGTYVVYDCWGKTCNFWSTKDKDLAQRWVGAAYLDGAMC